MTVGHKRLVQGFVALVAVAFIAVLSSMDLDRDSLTRAIPSWILLTFLFGFTEKVQVYFHDQAARFGLTGSEAVLLPMIVALTGPQVVLGVVTAVAFEGALRRPAPIKLLFNVSSYGCAAASSVYVWHALNAGSFFTVRNAAAAVTAVVTFSLVTHVLTSIVIALAERRSLLRLSRSVAPATVINLVGSIVLGMLLAASYEAAKWTLVLFPLPLFGLYFGYTATLRTQRERDRIEHLYAASRALAASRDLDESVTGFLRAVANGLSAVDVRLVLDGDDGPRWWGFHEQTLLASGEPLEPGPLQDALSAVSARGATLILGESEDAAQTSGLLTAMESRTLLVVPLMSEDRAIGCLMASGRVGAEDFAQNDARLVEALVNELQVTLDSFRLFAEVTEERERFARIFNRSQEGICLLEGNGTVRAWNPALERITGHPAIDLMGRLWSDVVVIRDREENRVVGQELISSPPDEELELVTRHGPSRWISVVSGAVGETEGGGWVVLIRDVTGEHELEAAKSDFLSTISHELRTPLTTIKGALQVLGRGRENLPGDLADQMVGVTTRGAERLERLVMNLLAVSQIESNSMNIFPDELRIEALAEDRFESMLAQHARKKIVLPDDTLVIRGDRERTTHVIEHLLDNAMKFGGADGEITLEVLRENGYAHLIVTDEGPGIAKADQERIFERFVRLGDVLTRSTQGAGVGLFIARRLVEAMGGEIWVESTLDEGAAFHATFPLAYPAVVPDRATGA